MQKDISDMRGSITGDHVTRRIAINGTPLDIGISRLVHDHSSVFSWGYCGSGCAQLALGILIEFVDPKWALWLHQDFKFDKLLPFENKADFQMPVADVILWLMGRSFNIIDGKVFPPSSEDQTFYKEVSGF